MNQYLLSLAILLLFGICNNTEVGEIIQLPEPKREGGMPLYEALNNRKSSRDFGESIEVSLETLSQALWCCYGVNRDGSFRTVPSAKAWYPFLIHVFVEDGVYLYNPEGHSLTKLFDGDYRYITGTQPEIVTKAGVNLVLVSDLNKPSRIEDNKSLRRLGSNLDIGNVVMTLYLFAAANNMKGVVRGNLNEYAILKFLNLSKEDYYIPLAFSLGY